MATLGKLLFSPCIYELDNTKVVKAKNWGWNLEYVLENARVLTKIKPHKNLNRFRGIVITEKRFGLAFDKIEGTTLSARHEPPQLKRAIEIVEVYCHLEKEGILYNDFSERNVMVTETGQTVVIDYDHSCLTTLSPIWYKTQRDVFGGYLQRVQESQKVQKIADKCCSDIPFEDFGWAKIFSELKELERTSLQEPKVTSTKEPEKSSKNPSSCTVM